MPLQSAAPLKPRPPLPLPFILGASGGKVSRLVHNFKQSRQPNLLFVHLPKCGGSSVHASLAEIYDTRLVNPERHNGLKDATSPRIPHHKLFSGHFDFASTLPLQDRFNLVSIFRTPRTRLVSMYNFLRAHRLDFSQSPVFRLHHLAHAHDIEDFFAQDEVRAHPAISNGLTRSLSDAPLPFYRWEDVAQVADDDDLDLRLKEAKSNLHAFRFIGQLSDMPQFLSAFEQYLDLPTLPEKRDQSLDTIMRERPAMRVIEPQKLSTDGAAVLDDLVAQDDALYAYAGQVFGWEQT